MNDLIVSENQVTKISDFGSKEEADQAKKSETWKSFANLQVKEAIRKWLGTMDERPHTQKAYRIGMKKLSELGFIDFESNLQLFSLVNHKAVIDRIKLIPEWSEATRQARAACYISFTGFLARRTDGLVVKAIPSTEGTSQTFYKIRDQVKTERLTQSEWNAFFDQLEKINPRDAMIGWMMLQGGKRVSEVLGVTIKQINWEKCEIKFIQLKTRGREKATVITYPDDFLNQVKEYIGDRQSGLVFLTETGKPVHPGQIERNFAKAGRLAGIPFKVTPHVMRTSLVSYLKDNGYGDTDIMKVTGHSSSAMIAAYDKTSPSDNPTKKIRLIPKRR
ncbi:site-specific integrase [bacterium]|nr:site-specific integrase [bacterium]